MSESEVPPEVRRVVEQARQLAEGYQRQIEQLAEVVRQEQPLTPVLIERDVSGEELPESLLAEVVRKLDGLTPKPEPELEKPQSGSAVEALLGDDAQAILAVARSAKSADDRMRDICAIDRRFLGYNSEQWAELLRVKGGAIRKTPFWKHDRQKAIEAGD